LHHFLANGRDRLAKHPIWLGQSEPLQKEQRHQTKGGVVIQALPGAALEVVQSDFLLQFPVPEFARLTLLRRLNQGLEGCFWREIAEIAQYLRSCSFGSDQ